MRLTQLLNGPTATRAPVREAWAFAARLVVNIAIVAAFAAVYLLFLKK